MKKEIGYIGLGKMGSSMVALLKQKKWRVETFDISGSGTSVSIAELVQTLGKPRIIWIMVPATAKSVRPAGGAAAGKPALSPVDAVIAQLDTYLEKGDVVIDGGNSFYGNTVKRSEKLAKKGIFFLDVGVSGGPGTVRSGKPALMIGGERRIYDTLRPLFCDLTGMDSIGYMGKSGSGHFVKMVHNGIEYGMMQAIAEGFTVMKKGPFQLDVTEVARVYNNGSVIESRLTGWLESGYKKFGPALKESSGSVKHTGEGEWTVKEAKRLKLPVPVIRASLEFRVASKKKPSYTGKILTTLRNQFGGHDVR